MPRVNIVVVKTRVQPLAPSICSIAAGYAIKAKPMLDTSFATGDFYPIRYPIIENTAKPAKNEKQEFKSATMNPFDTIGTFCSL